MAAVIHAIMTPLPTTTSQQPHQPALRRATYVHVSDLTSAYNIDHARLDQELGRVKAEREATIETQRAVAEVPDTDEDVTQASELDASLATIPQKRLQPPRGGYNLCVLVGKVNVVVDKRRVDRSRVRLAEVEIGDETGTVSLRARDEQIDVLEDVSKRDGAVVLRNCTLELYQGKHIRLAVTKWGKLCTYPDTVASTPPPPSKMNVDRNFSLIDLSVVASEMVDPTPEQSYNPRPTKPTEASEGGSPGGGRAPGSKQGGSAHRQGQQYQQAQPSTRRGSRGGDRRQARTKQSGGGNTPQTHYSGGSPSAAEGGPMQQVPSQMRYQGMHGYTPGYDQAMDVRQYSYPHSRQQDLSAQQMMLHQHQHYEMQQMQQQRQLQHMYHSQQDRHSPMRQGHQMQPTPMMVPTVVGSGSFDGAGDYSVSSYAGSEQHQSVMAVVGSNPLLMPMNIPAATRLSGGMAGSPSAASAQQQYGVSLGPRMMMPGGMSTNPMESSRHDHQRRKDGPQHSLQAEGSYGMDRDRQHHQMSLPHPHSQSQGMESQFAAGKMNPQASVFAPSYMTPTTNPQGTHQGYYPFNPSQGATGPMYRHGLEYPSMYDSSAGVVYVSMDAASTKASLSPEEAMRGAPTPGSGEAGSDSQASGKENVQSGS